MNHGNVRAITSSLAVVLIAVLLMPRLASAGGSPPGTSGQIRYDVQARSRGLVLTLYLPFPPYPRNALTKAHVRLWNSTQYPIRVFPPIVQVLWPSGKVAYSDYPGGYPFRVVAPSRLYAAPQGPPPAAPVVPPRKAIAIPVFVLLRTGRVRASVTIAPNTNRAMTLTTPVLRTAIGPPDYPTIRIRRVDGSVVAFIKPPARQGGTVWYMSVTRCGATTAGTAHWIRVPYADIQPDESYRLPAPGCADPTAWSLVAAWIDQSAGAANYRS